MWRKAVTNKPPGRPISPAEWLVRPASKCPVPMAPSCPEIGPLAWHETGPPRAKPSLNALTVLVLTQEQVANGLTDFESFSVSATSATLLELLAARLTETENSRAL